ncbi:MAG: tRNA uracil 4-sulfurtransferase ThiI [Anaeroplasmataceae bacterium]
MIYDQILVRFGDLTLKGKNQKDFFSRLIRLIHLKLKDLNVNISHTHDRVYIDLLGTDYKKVVERLDLVSGLSSYSLVVKVENDIDKICAKACELVDEEALKPVMFKVSSKRADKRFPLTSPEMNKIISSAVLKHNKNLKVDVHNPELVLYVELRNEGTYLYTTEFRGFGGFPVGVAGKGLVMLSGGIDSPVCGILAQKQGIEIECIHFESTPLTSIESAQKVVDLVKIMSKYAPNDKIKLHMVPFKELHMALLENIPESYNITIMRRMMYRIATKLAKKRDCLVIINGESVGQVASQTLYSMNVINSVTNMPIIRPLCTYDKVDIIKLANKFGTFETSIKPFEDCCTVYVPKAPATHPKLDKCLEYEAKFDYEKFVCEAVENTKTIELTPDSDLDLSMLGLEVRSVI